MHIFGNFQLKLDQVAGTCSLFWLKVCQNLCVFTGLSWNLGFISVRHVCRCVVMLWCPEALVLIFVCAWVCVYIVQKTCFAEWRNIGRFPGQSQHAGNGPLDVEEFIPHRCYLQTLHLHNQVSHWTLSACLFWKLHLLQNVAYVCVESTIHSKFANPSPQRPKPHRPTESYSRTRCGAKLVMSYPQGPGMLNIGDVHTS